MRRKRVTRITTRYQAWLARDIARGYLVRRRSWELNARQQEYQRELDWMLADFERETSAARHTMRTAPNRVRQHSPGPDRSLDSSKEGL